MYTVLRSLILTAFVAVSVGATPVVDGKIEKGEYASSKSVLDGASTLYYSADGSGGLFVALETKTLGWAGIGLGSKRMDGARIYMGFVKDNTPVFSEQLGSGHRHGPVKDKSADKSIVAQNGSMNVLEFHLPADKLPFKGKSVNYIAAFAAAADLTSFHEDNFDSGTFTLP
jgi:hypothetical protein